jgi:hypothetical protein
MMQFTPNGARMSLPLSLLIAATSSAHAGPPKLLDATWTAAMCEAWNDTSLPANLGRAGSGWIDSAGSEGHQVVVISRRDCSGWAKVQLVIDADAKGEARCTSGGAHTGGPFQWQFTPTTRQWADFADGFGVTKMPGIMNGFVGPYPVAAANISNFEVFFARAGKLALDMDVDWTCEGADAAKIAEDVADIDRADMEKILR